ncbi:hypothetical protein GCM10008107_26040 [Psychrosphaera saromensis]|uniref:J domain-containing protein n=1 Tax=Psychrosphaera saromensis TaxID=716813 RepID=A0A2S7UWN9_9GAMM|nr:DNA-J related domain-containing protein [Psychrosphaera saromensis]PQJ54189.1 hypothetical protein BTO11_11360 [Psychrosphaera saromensis]GHB75228.1 hypothetical protein GCM10008107_26040 [Psychrosphaera saromensis]GLQ12716.1 hypothetical protein GCM10007917_01710 [Psychrosphaera saromensis]
MENLELDQALMELISQEAVNGGISEYEIISKFKSAPYHLFNAEVMSNNLSLFQTHFVIFNALYRLRDLGLELNQFDIDIISSNIRLMPLSQSNSTSTQDGASVAGTGVQNREERQAIEKLRTYYLNWDNFEKTTETSVNNLLDSFWNNMSSRSPVQRSQDNLTQSLTILELTDLPSELSLKRQYKKLCNIHHPDKGGCQSTFQKVHLAYQYIKQRV